MFFHMCTFEKTIRFYVIIQESIGSALVIAVMKYKKHGIKLLKKSHPALVIVTKFKFLLNKPFLNSFCKDAITESPIKKIDFSLLELNEQKYFFL